MRYDFVFLVSLNKLQYILLLFLFTYMCTIQIFSFCFLFAVQYNIKKKEEAPEAEAQKEPDNPLMRKKKTPEELAKEAEEADQDELTSKADHFE